MYSYNYNHLSKPFMVLVENYAGENLVDSFARVEHTMMPWLLTKVWWFQQRIQRIIERQLLETDVGM